MPKEATPAQRETLCELDVVAHDIAILYITQQTSRRASRKSKA